ncbi:MAG TPA: hypothetical protein VLT36_06115 [Candidatus Dormibacteraeota bacterium]|nr:hypothetical protein [Candidatus Dormibacteraeota bacterium]
MKMLFLASDDAKVELVSRALKGAGISCEIRKGPVFKAVARTSNQVELWLENDTECHKALMVWVGLGLLSRGVTRG